MRNLRNVFLKKEEIPPGLPLTATAWDPTNDSIICAFGPTATNAVIHLKRKTQQDSGIVEDSPNRNPSFASITSWDAPCPLPSLLYDEILLLHFLSDISTVCLVLAGGDIVVVREDPSPGEEKIEIVGSVDAGISAATWSPDEELLALVTQADTLVFMSKEFEPVTEISLGPEDVKASKHVSVGWGKKETQFQGKRAKALRDPTMPEFVAEGKLSAQDDKKTSICWRGDGLFVAMNSIVSDNRRVIRVYTREGVLESASEPVDGLEKALSWRPAGNLISGVQRLDDRVEIVFFERNGLRHGEFPLRISKTEIDSWGSEISLSWNIDSTVLAVIFMDRVQLWTMGNYHYYLKQEIFSKSDAISESTVAFRWHPEKSLRCSMLTSASVLDMEYVFVVSRGSTIRPYDHGIVAVIDGRNLKLTPLKHATVPPPMAFCDILLDDNITDCSISLSGQRVAVLTTKSLEIYDWALAPIPSTTAIKVLSLPLGEARYLQVLLRGEMEAFLVVLPRCRNSKIVQRVSLENPTVSVQLNQKLDVIPQTSSSVLPTHTIFTDVHHLSILVQEPDVAFDPDLSSFEWPLVRSDTNEAHPWTEMVYFDPPNGTVLSTGIETRPGTDPGPLHGEFYQFSLSRKGELFANQKLLARNCTSFLVTDAHLLFTTSQHLLKFVHIARESDLEVPADIPEADERCRSIERGAKLVTVSPSTYAVILQMPRGNLETIYPRALVLAGIRQHIDDRDYKSAFLACRNHQVDMNIMHDYNPGLFMKSVPLFVQQVKKVSRISDFLSNLKEEDVTQTLYKDTLKGPSFQISSSEQMINGVQPSTNSNQSKVNRICDVFLAELEPNLSTHLQNVVTAHVCKRPPDLTAGLLLVADLRQKGPSQAETAVEHLCFLADANRLYDTALSLYDLELALLIAQQSQKDPREYLPFLQSLHALPPFRRQFQIDDHLSNFSKALVSLHALSVHDEVQSYTVKHSLYTAAIILYRYDTSHFKTISALYADHLNSQSRYSDAAITYESLGDYSSAYPAYALAHLWREALTCAGLVPLIQDQMRSLAQSLAMTCVEESRDYRSAATIYLDYLSDVPGAARLLCKGSYFADSSRILALHGLQSLIPELLDAGLTEKFGEIIELVADCKAQLNVQVPRIKELRVKKSEDPLAFFGGDAATAVYGAVDIPDNVSLAPTDASTTGGQSLFTRYGSSSNSKFGGTVASNASRKTSKTRRREERKRARGKQGSVYEEEYLAGSVRRLIEKINSVQDEVKRLLTGLFRRGMRDRAAAVDEAMADMARLCQNARKDLWEDPEQQQQPPPPPPGKVSEGYEVNGEGRPPGADGVFWDSQMEGVSARKKDPPEVKEWKVVSLLVGEK